MKATLTLCALLPLLAHAADPVGTLPAVRLERWAQGFAQPVHLVFSPGQGIGHVVEQKGTIRRRDGAGPKHPLFLDIADRVDAGGEKGLLGLAFHPGYDRNRRFFVNYTTQQGGGLATRISEFRASEDGLRADPGSERVLLRLAQPYANHNGGMVLFGPDGYLYIGTGDGGASNDPKNHGQRLDTLLGKMLRLDVDRVPDGATYGIPPNNPFVGQPGVRPEIYAYGLRNPWRYSFDRAEGALWCGDVGQNAREEIDLIVKGGNYGWRLTEGFICTPGVNPDCVTNGLIAPVVDYPRKEGVSVTGGYVYRGNQRPALQGVYFYGDFASGHLWGLRYAGGRVVAHGKVQIAGPPVSSFAEDLAGELYLVSHRGDIFQLVD